ncbi:hypothetical protein DKX38_011266 [Salix brachista]|uniref:Uncharacterized protein n=1 Tax=Salix brachista TaxID=2182728 RepID=A0A5N5LYN5_9ROSI|nr:hypothetical protein DKX38_011266 [Salix brachista]
MYLILTISLIIARNFLLQTRKQQYKNLPLSEDVSELEEALQFRDMMNQYGEFSKETHLENSFPIPSNIDYDGFIKRMKTLSQSNCSCQKLIDKHRADRDWNTMANHLLALKETQPQFHTNSILKGLVLFHRLITLTLGSLIQCFTVDDKEINVDEKVATLMSRVQPLELVLKARPDLANILS